MEAYGASLLKLGLPPLPRPAAAPSSRGAIVSFCFACHLFWTTCSPFHFTATLDTSGRGWLCAMCFGAEAFSGHMGAFDAVRTTWLNPGSCLWGAAPGTDLQGQKHTQVRQQFLAPKHHKAQRVITPTQTLLHGRPASRNPHHVQQMILVWNCCLNAVAIRIINTSDAQKGCVIRVSN